MSPNRSAGRSLFAAARTSKDLSLVAFATALFIAFVLQAGAFLPRLASPWPVSAADLDLAVSSDRDEACETPEEGAPPPTAQVGREPTAAAFAATRDPGTPEEARAQASAPCEPRAARL